jgi:hypothetical protein
MQRIFRVTPLLVDLYFSSSHDHLIFTSVLGFSKNGLEMPNIIFVGTENRQQNDSISTALDFLPL